MIKPFREWAEMREEEEKKKKVKQVVVREVLDEGSVGDRDGSVSVKHRGGTPSQTPS